MRSSFLVRIKIHGRRFIISFVITKSWRWISWQQRGYTQEKHILFLFVNLHFKVIHNMARGRQCSASKSWRVLNGLDLSAFSDHLSFLFILSCWRCEAEKDWTGRGSLTVCRRHCHTDKTVIAFFFSLHKVAVPQTDKTHHTDQKKDKKGQFFLRHIFAWHWACTVRNEQNVHINRNGRIISSLLPLCSSNFSFFQAWNNIVENFFFFSPVNMLQKMGISILWGGCQTTNTPTRRAWTTALSIFQ